jgi:predicted DNA-binding transcriptional regulator AlpA
VIEKLLTPREVAEAFGVNISWVYSKAETGAMPSVKLGK